MKLYELTAEYDRLMDAEGEEAETALAEICGSIQKKTEGICKFIANMDADVSALKAEEQRLSQRRKAIENKVESVRNYLMMQMLEHDITKIDAGLFKLSLSATSGQVVIDDQNTLPAKYKTIVQEVKVDKTAIKDAIKRGEAVPGASIAEGYSLRIR